MLVGHNVLSNLHPDRVQPTALYLDDNPHAAAYALQTADPFCRLGDKGNPSAEHLANKANGLPLRVNNVGVLNELNHPVEQWQGDPASYAALLRAMRSRVGLNRRLWAMAPSPDSPRWEEYLRLSHSVTGLQQLHCYGTTLDALKSHYTRQKGIIGSARIRVTEINWGWGNTVDKDRWADEALRPFLDYLATDPLCEGAYFFSYDRWNADTDPGNPNATPIFAVGTRVAEVIDTWKPQKEKPMFDPRLESLGVTVQRATGAGGAWRVTRLEYQDETESGGRHHIDIMEPHDPTQLAAIDNGDEVWWLPLEKPVGEPAQPFAMWAGNVYSVKMGGVSDTVRGLRMRGPTPDSAHQAHHIVFRIWFEWQAATTPPPPASTVNWAKVCWNFEEVARRLRDEGHKASHDWVLNSASYKEALRNRG